MNNGSTKAKSTGDAGAAAATASGVSIDDLARQIETIRSDLSTLASLFGEVGKAEASRARDNLKAQGQAAQDITEEQLEHIRRKAVGYRNDAEDFVQRKPEAALGIAAGLGLLVGLFLSSRR